MKVIFVKRMDLENGKIKGAWQYEFDDVVDVINHADGDITMVFKDGSKDYVYKHSFRFYVVTER